MKFWEKLEKSQKNFSLNFLHIPKQYIHDDSFHLRNEKHFLNITNEVINDKNVLIQKCNIYNLKKEKVFNLKKFIAYIK